VQESMLKNSLQVHQGFKRENPRS